MKKRGIVTLMAALFLLGSAFTPGKVSAVETKPVEAIEMETVETELGETELVEVTASWMCSTFMRSVNDKGKGCRTSRCGSFAG